MSEAAAPAVRPPRVPATVVYGTKPPKISLRMGKNGWQTYFCAANHNLHLSYERDFREGTYTLGHQLNTLCDKYCRPHRVSRIAPCPAFAESHMIGTADQALATVELRAKPLWERCAGAQHLLDVCETADERDFLRMYWDSVSSFPECEFLADAWKESWSYVPSVWPTRTAKFDTLMWATMRHPALIPQAWVNWLGEASDDDRSALENNPSRVDFVAFYCGQRFVVEIDGPSHYASFDGRSYLVDESTAARTLKCDRSLRAQGWTPIHIARIEVREAMKNENPWPVVSTLGFRGVGGNVQPAEVGVPELGELDYSDFIPF